MLETIRAQITSLTFWKKWAWIIVRFVLIVGLSFVILYPILQKVSTSLKAREDIYSPIVVWIPERISFESYKYAVQIMEYWDTLLNTFLLAGMTTVLTAASCALAGYGFARLKFKGSKLLFACVILTILVPPTTILIPMYLNLKDFNLLGLIPLLTGGKSINLLDTYWPFILTSMFAVSYKAGLFIFIYNQFYRGIPKEIEEAAYVDGAGVTKTFLQIMLPNTMPAIITVCLFSFVWQWNDSFYTTTYLTSTKVMSTQLSSLPFNLNKLITGDGGGQSDPFYLDLVQDTGILLAILPLIIGYLFIQRHFVESVERTGIVG